LERFITYNLKMRRRDEVMDPFSCFNRAREDEMVFVLLGRDVAAAPAIRAWANARIERGKNKPEDHQIKEALACADIMEREAAEREQRIEASLQKGRAAGPAA
jgi:hypothetical protein